MQYLHIIGLRVARGDAGDMAQSKDAGMTNLVRMGSLLAARIEEPPYSVASRVLLIPLSFNHLSDRGEANRKTEEDNSDDRRIVCGGKEKKMNAAKSADNPRQSTEPVTYFVQGIHSDNDACLKCVRATSEDQPNRIHSPSRKRKVVFWYECG